MSAIAAGDQTTADAGLQILRLGGNAVDAAVAAAFVSFIAEISIVQLGGSGVAQVFLPETGRTITYDFFSAMPGLGSGAEGNNLDFERVTVDFGPATQDFYLGRGSVAVPGNIFGLCQVAADHGRLPLALLLEPAISLAHQGHVLAPFQAETIHLLEPIFTNTRELRRIFAPGGKLVKAGSTLLIPGLIETLEQLAVEGPELARNGRLGRSFVADQRSNGGLVTAEDLETYEVKQLRPIQVDYRGYNILLPPPCSSGGALTAFTLKLLARFPVNQFRHGSTRHLQLLFELMAATSRARPVWETNLLSYGPKMAIQILLSDKFIDEHVEQVKKAIKKGRSSPVFGEQPGHSDTSHISIVDDDGMAVSLTTTAGESAGYVLPGTGFIPNNILGEADLHPKGFHSLPAGDRISTMVTPTIVLQEGFVRLVVGSGGSIRIRSAILQVLSNLLDFGMSLKNAVEAARVHLENGVFECELGYDAQAIDDLEATGYPINRWDRRSIYFGGAHSVSRTASGRLVAAGDDRRGGSVAVTD